MLKAGVLVLILQMLTFLNSDGDEEKAVHNGNSMKERRKSISSSSGPNFSRSSNLGERRKSMSNSSSSNIPGSTMGERRSSFSNISGHSPPSNTLSPPPAVQVLSDLFIVFKIF